MSRAIDIAGTKVGEGHPVFIAAEIGANHNGDVELARRIVAECHSAGCQAVKFQKRTPERCTPREQRSVPRETPWGVMPYLEYRQRLEFGLAEYQAIDAFCRHRGLPWFASAWDVPSVAFLERFEVPCFKVPSACLTDARLLRRVRAARRPVILSTGMSTLAQIRRAVEILGPEQLLITHCTSAYPCREEELNLRMIPRLRQEFGCLIGYSGHERGLASTYAAVALGAMYVERHVTIDRTMWGTDQAASLEPRQLRRLIRNIRTVEQALGDGEKRIFESERETQARLRRYP